MNLPVQITFRGMNQSDAVEAYARQRADKLERFYSAIMRCHIVIDVPHRHQRHGSRYDVRVDLTVPGDELVVSRNVGSLAHEELYACIDQAFDDAQRLLEDHARKRRQDVKRHEITPHGRVVHLADYEGYGYLETVTGERVYFHRNSVLNGAFERLEVGDEVRFVVEEGREGPQASTVELLHRARRRRRARSQAASG